ncbi:MAG: acyl-CoA thioesterase [Planctomycetia bacterium]|nr:acyl-CoA thioesterase [Planctomycetia bacterium]
MRYFECDAQKVVFNVRYGDYVDLAVCEFFRALGFGDLLIDGPLDYQLVKQTIEWKSPARVDQVLEISVVAKHLGTTSFTLSTAFRIAGQADVIAATETVYVLVDATTLTKTPPPQDLRDALHRGAVGLFVDHADSASKPA